MSSVSRTTRVSTSGGSSAAEDQNGNPIIIQDAIRQSPQEESPPLGGQSNGLDLALNAMPEAQQSNVTEGMTSAGRLDQMLGSDSPLMKRARTQGQQEAAQRGLLNSSMAAGAAQGAMIDRAQPFAMQDSNTLVQNQQFNTEAQNQRGLLQSQMIGQDFQDRQQQGFQMDRDAALFDQQVELQARDYGLRSDILRQETDATMENLFGTSVANAWGAMGTNITSSVAQALDAVNRIQLDPDISSSDKTRLINQITSMRDADIRFQQNLFDSLPGYLRDTNVFPTV